MDNFGNIYFDKFEIVIKIMKYLFIFIRKKMILFLFEMILM